MAKKDFKSGIENLLGGSSQPSAKVETAEAGNYGRTSLIINLEKYEKLREVAFQKNLAIKDVLEVAMDMFIEKYESKNGPIKPKPQAHKGDVKNIFD